MILIGRLFRIAFLLCSAAVLASCPRTGWVSPGPIGEGEAPVVELSEIAIEGALLEEFVPDTVPSSHWVRFLDYGALPPSVFKYQGIARNDGFPSNEVRHAQLAMFKAKNPTTIHFLANAKSPNGVQKLSIEFQDHLGNRFQVPNAVTVVGVEKNGQVPDALYIDGPVDPNGATKVDDLGAPLPLLFTLTSESDLARGFAPNMTLIVTAKGFNGKETHFVIQYSI